MSFGLTSAEYDLLFKLIIQPLKQSGAKVWIFGSRAAGTHSRFSDIDILFESGIHTTPILISKLREDAEESMLPYKLDLVNAEDIAQEYKEQVMNTRKPI